MRPSRGFRRPFLRRWRSTALGATAALLLFEAGLRLIAAPPLPPRAAVAEDRPRDPIRVRRIHHEGIAVSRFSPAHSRLTGGRWIDGATIGVIVGDSHLEAVSVADHHTLGAVAERALRRQGTAVNVRQYSRVGASAPALAREAPEIIARWDPPWVVALLADNDLATSALVGRSRFAIEPDGSFRLVTGPGPPPLRGLRGLWRRIYEGSSRHSILAYASFRRVGQVRGEPLRPDPPLRPDNPRYPILRHVSSVSVRALHAAYGDRLLIVYLPHVGATPDEDYHHHEAGLLEACRVEGVRCLSMRADFLRARERDHRLTRGFVNTPPAWGHLNEHGHRLVGEAIAREVGR